MTRHDVMANMVNTNDITANMVKTNDTFEVRGPQLEGQTRLAMSPRRGLHAIHEHSGAHTRRETRPSSIHQRRPRVPQSCQVAGVA